MDDLQFLRHSNNCFRDANKSLKERCDELCGVLEYVAPALMVLHNMLRTAGLSAGEAKVTEMLAEIERAIGDLSEDQLPPPSMAEGEEICF